MLDFFFGCRKSFAWFVSRSKSIEKCDASVCVLCPLPRLDFFSQYQRVAASSREQQQQQAVAPVPPNQVTRYTQSQCFPVYEIPVLKFPRLSFCLFIFAAFIFFFFFFVSLFYLEVVLVECCKQRFIVILWFVSPISVHDCLSLDSHWNVISTKHLLLRWPSTKCCFGFVQPQQPKRIYLFISHSPNQIANEIKSSFFFFFFTQFIWKSLGLNLNTHEKKIFFLFFSFFQCCPLSLFFARVLHKFTTP